MRSLLAATTLFLFAPVPSNAWAEGLHYTDTHARHKSGPVTMRGVARHVDPRGFTLQTTSHGSYAVNATPPTHVIEKNRSGHVTVIEGNHVGVRGYVNGRTIRAIEVRVYPVKPKPSSVRGTITSVTGNRLGLGTNAGSLTVLVTAITVIRTSSGVLAVSALRVGDRVEARVVVSGHEWTALHIHVYRVRAPARHVQLRGTVTATGGRSMVVAQAGAQHTVGLTAATRYYAGTTRTSASPRRGEAVTVYACCAGRPLVATSIHMHRQTAVAHPMEWRGTVVALSATSLRLNTRNTPVILFQSSTAFELGATRIIRTGVRLGDTVRVRGHESGGMFRATRVHVYGASRKTSWVRGPVTGVASSSMRVVQRGVTYVVVIGTSTRMVLSGRTVRLREIRPGDRANALGHLSGHQLQAMTVDLKRSPPKIDTVRGTVTSAGANWLVVTRSSGAKDTVRLDSHTHVAFGGRPASGNVLFPGIHVVARGSRSRTELLASTVTATARSTSRTGRLSGVVGRTLLLRRSDGKVERVELPPGLAPKDGARTVPLQVIGRGAYMHVTGYVQLSKAIRALSLTVLHPSVDVAGLLSWQGRIATVRTSTAETYVALFGPHTSIVASRLAVRLHPTDIPDRTEVHVVGTINTAGSLALQSVIARLRSVIVRATAGSTESNSLELTLAGSTVHVRFIAATTVLQGSRPLRAADMVPGDDITIYGYKLRGGGILARKVTVHRRILGLDGIVASVTGQSFQLTAADGIHTVVVNDTTLVIGVAGTILASGMKVHVTGYLRGDGTILATRLRILKA